MWVTTPFVELAHRVAHLIAFSFHTCMFAAKRKKDTAIWTSVPQLKQYLERKCDGSHPHLPWGRTASGFATAEECAYNDNLLCAAWAGAIADFAATHNFGPLPGTVDQLQPQFSGTSYLNKAILGCLPRGWLSKKHH